MHPWDSVAAVGLEVGTVLGFLAEFEANNATIFLKGLCSACSLLSTVVNFVMFIESQPLCSTHTQIHIAQCWNITLFSNTQIHISHVRENVYLSGSGLDGITICSDSVHFSIVVIISFFLMPD